MLCRTNPSISDTSAGRTQTRLLYGNQSILVSTAFMLLASYLRPAMRRLRESMMDIYGPHCGVNCEPSPMTHMFCHAQFNELAVWSSSLRLVIANPITLPCVLRRTTTNSRRTTVRDLEDAVRNVAQMDSGTHDISLFDLLRLHGPHNTFLDTTGLDGTKIH
jgi:hypothetical protein